MHESNSVLNGHKNIEITSSNKDQLYYIYTSNVFKSCKNNVNGESKQSHFQEHLTSLFIVLLVEVNMKYLSDQFKIVFH